jgi:hypothetical protein
MEINVRIVAIEEDLLRYSQHHQECPPSRS